MRSDREQADNEFAASNVNSTEQAVATLQHVRTSCCTVVSWSSYRLPRTKRTDRISSSRQCQLIDNDLVARDSLWTLFRHQPTRLNTLLTFGSRQLQYSPVVLNFFHCWDPLNATDVVWDPQVKIEKVCAPE